ncbi:MAG: GNAT family N-acetyltransferase [Rhodocyclaceae bacterium]|nr:GNAT family N-acetyltransferase [Rhodocyclaceae bacterium]
MLSHAWVEAYVSHLMPSGSEFRCAMAFSGDRLAGVLPLEVRALPGSGGRICAAQTPYHAHSPNGDVLAVPAGREETVPMLLLAAANALPGCRELALRGAVSGSATGADGCRPAARLRSMSVPRGFGSYLETTGEWAHYHARLSKNFRANLRKAEHRAVQAGPRRVCVLRNAEAGEAFLDGFLTLEASGWKGREGSAIQQNPSLKAFYGRMIRNAMAAGWLEGHLLEIGKTPVAAHLGLRLGRRLVLLKIAYDETRSDLSPGVLLFRDIAEAAFADPATDEINCLTDMEWHRPWRMNRRAYADLRYFPRTFAGSLLGAAPRYLIGFAKALANRRLKAVGPAPRASDP